MHVSYQLADRVRVKVMRVDPLERRIDFRLAGDAPTRADQQPTHFHENRNREPKKSSQRRRHR